LIIRLFNFAIGLFIPPAFENISWKLFIIFGVLCIGASIQAFFTYPETCGKTLEEIESMFRKGGQKPWHTKPGDSLLDKRILEIQETGKVARPLMQGEGEGVVEFHSSEEKIAV